MRALKGGLQRICEDHRTSVGVQYRMYCDSFLERSGPLPKYAMSKLRELAVIETVELPRLLEQEHAIRAKKPTPKLETELRRMARTRHRLRVAARGLEQDLERLSGKQPSVNDPLAALMNGVSE